MANLKREEIKNVAHMTKIAKNSEHGTYTNVYYDYTSGELFAHIDTNIRFFNMAKRGKLEADMINDPERAGHLVGMVRLTCSYTATELTELLPKLFEACERDWEEFERTVLKREA